MLPPFVIFVLTHLARAVAQQRVYACAERLVKAPRTIRVDAQASAERCGIGGWMVAVDPQGHPDPWSSPWFSEEIREEDAGWVFAREGKASRTIATLEGLATLLGILLFSPVSAPRDRVEQTIVPSLTDNKGNGLVLNKLMTTRFPLLAVVMELGAVMKRRRIRGHVQWATRTTNQKADCLANGRPSGFDPSKRLRFNLGTIGVRYSRMRSNWGQNYRGARDKGSRARRRRAR